MAARGGHILVVDDNILNRMMLARAVEEQGHAVTTAEDGAEALRLLRSERARPFDVILLDILMPEMDGYQVLEQVKGDSALRHIPVIMITALDEMDSVLRCIESGATDYLPKPFDPALLQARLNASMAEKRLRDLELEYLEQVGHVVGAAQAVEAARFDPACLDDIATREDALGQLARVFQRMAREVHLREQRLKQQLQQLRLDMAEMRGESSEAFSAYLPMDRRQALVQGASLPARTTGAALFADISGFTPLTEALARELGLERGAEELTRTINQVYGSLIAEVHRYRGSVIGFSGDAITCWFDETPSTEPEPALPPAGLRGAACALATQEAMAAFSSIATPAGTRFGLSIKVAVVTGPVRRFLLGDPGVHIVEAIAGRTLDRLAAAEHLANSGEVVADAAIVRQAGGQIIISGGRTDKASGERFALIAGLTAAVLHSPWPDVPPGALTERQCRPWLAPAVYERLRGSGELFLSELRTVTALFLRFEGIDYDGDDGAGGKLDAFVRWVQSVLVRHEGSLFQLTMGDKGSYMCLAFGTPIAHNDDEVRAIYAALELRATPPELSFITGIQIGLAQGLMRTGACGSGTRHIYSIQGDRANLAARLMMAASDGILCDEAVYRATQGQVACDPLEPMAVKGKSQPVPVFRVVPATAQGAITSRIDRLSPNEQLTLKVASVIGSGFGLDVLQGIYPVESEVPRLGDTLEELEKLALISKDEEALGERPPDGRIGLPHVTGAEADSAVYRFRSTAIHEAVYNSMLYTQRRHLHRLVAEWIENRHAVRGAHAGDLDACADELGAYAEALAHHWRNADEPAKAVHYLEKAAQQARSRGDLMRAEQLLRQSLDLDACSAVLSAEYAVDPGEDTSRAVDQDGSGEPDFEGALRYALDRLESDLPPELTYHNLVHTRDDVLPAARRLATMMGVSEAEVRLLEIGAACHDLGFTVQRHDHERAGAELCGQVLPRFGFDEEQVAAVQGMIMATKLPQSPHTLLEEILADADLDNLGRDDALERSLALRSELSALGAPIPEDEWFERQLRFLRDHRYWTEAARSQRSEGKKGTIATMERLLADAHKSPQ